MSHTIPLRAPLDDSGLPRKEPTAGPAVPRPSIPAPRQGDDMSSLNFSVPFQQVLDRITPHLPPYLLKIEPDYGRVRFEFRPFTGLETEPAKPQSYYDDPQLTHVDESQDVDEYRLRMIARNVLGDLYEQAAREWGRAAYVAELRRVVKDAPDRWRAYEREAKALEAAYAYLRTPEAGREWPAAISRLVDAQDATLAAAAAFDERAAEIAYTHDKHLYADLGHVDALAKAGYPEANDWHVGDGFGGYFRDGLAEKVTGLIKEQETHLVKVGRLSGTTPTH
ncbi:hypothetical protein [Streptomyces rochei]|uniref:hypothetical protein n=2 Tax=Streptomyces TaxID=1883 RepID=UPI0022E9AE65|nr:hypothetical protein [Streptomyces rochei]MCC8455388.1 hypothetical protein [Streptomyces rochei]